MARDPARDRRAAPARTAGLLLPGAAPRAASRPWRDRARRRWSALRPAARRRCARDRRPAGRDRARAAPNDHDPAAELALETLERREEREGAGRRIRAGRRVECHDRVAELGLVDDADRLRRVQAGDGTNRLDGSAASARTAATSVASASPTLAPRPSRRGLGGRTRVPSGAARLRAMRPVSVRILHPGPGPDQGPLERWLAEVRGGGRPSGMRRHLRAPARATPDRQRAARRDAVRRAAPRHRVERPRRRARRPRLRARSRWRPRPIAGRSWPPLRRRRRALANNRYSADVVAIAAGRDAPRDPGPARRQRAPALARGGRGLPRSTTCGGAGGSGSTSTARSISCSSATGATMAPADIARASRHGWRRPGRRRRSARRAAGRRPDVGGDAGWLERHTAGRVRALVEERGLRARRGWRRRDADRAGPPAPARVLGSSSTRPGPARWATMLARLGDAAIIDTGCSWPIASAPTRRAGRPPRTGSPPTCCCPSGSPIRGSAALTASAAAAPIPILLGGHTLVGPGMRLVIGGAAAGSVVDVTPGLRRDPAPDLDAVGQDEALVGADPRRDRARRPDDLRPVHGAGAVRPGWRLLPRPRRAPGRDGDFLTAPEPHPIFGAALSRAVADAWDRARTGRSRSCVREHGAGTGALAVAILDALATRAAGSRSVLRYEPVEVEPRRLGAIAARLGAAGHGARLRRAHRRIARSTGSSWPTRCSTPCRSTASSGAAGELRESWSGVGGRRASSTSRPTRRRRRWPRGSPTKASA